MSNSLVHILGTRPNFVKAAPVIDALTSLGIPQLLIHTGQHYDPSMSDVFFSELGLPKPHFNLRVGSGTHAVQTARLMAALEVPLLQARPSLVIVYGDVNSTLAAALVASKLQIPVAHVEAGLRSFDRTMPEEINRVVVDAIASLHFVTSPEAIANLADEGISPNTIHFVGNPMIDTLERCRPLFDTDRVRNRHGLPESYGLVTLHRPANVDRMERVTALVRALAKVARDTPLLFPVHPRGIAILERAGLRAIKNLVVTGPMPYVDFLSAMQGASFVITDSGGIQEEATVIGVPCLTMRDNTERPITISYGTNTLVGSDPDLLVEAVAQLGERRPTQGIPPLWDGKAGTRIASILADTWRRTATG